MLESFGSESNHLLKPFASACQTGLLGNVEPIDGIISQSAVKNLVTGGTNHELINAPLVVPRIEDSLILGDKPLASQIKDTSKSIDKSVDSLTGIVLSQGTDSDRELLPIIQQAVRSAHDSLTGLATDPDYNAKMNLAFGDNFDTKVANDIVQKLAKGDFSEIPAIKVLSSAAINGANGAYAAQIDTIFISNDFVSSHSVQEVAGVLLEEIGHSIDRRINSVDAAGDEGNIFSKLVQGKDIYSADLALLKQEDDSALIWYNGQEIAIEMQYEDQYLVGDWDGDGKDNIAVRRGNQILIDYNFDGSPERIQTYGNGNSEDQYLVGDWNGDGKDNIAVRRGNQILMDYNFDGSSDRIQTYGSGNTESQYLVGDWNGDGKDNIAVRRGNQILMDYNFDGSPDLIQTYGSGNIESQYLVGDWNGDRRDNIAVRRDNQILMDYNFDGSPDLIQTYGIGNTEGQYLVGDWNGDRRDNIAIRRGNQILMDYNFDGSPDLIQTYGNGTAPVGIDIQLYYPKGGFTQSEINLMEKAAQNWERIITKDKDSSGVLKISVLKEVPSDSTYWAQTIQDIGVNYRKNQSQNYSGQNIDIMGVDYGNQIRFNPNTFSTVLQQNSLVRLAMHEIGHTLGLDHEEGVSLMHHNYFHAKMTDSMYKTMTEQGYKFDRNVPISWY